LKFPVILEIGTLDGNCVAERWKRRCLDSELLDSAREGRIKAKTVFGAELLGTSGVNLESNLLVNAALDI
jgi:hypothetical protein